MYLVDTSALYPLLLRMREELVFHKDILHILDLTVYEVGNVLWKKHREGKVRDLESVVKLFQYVLRQLPKLSIEDFSEILNLAIKEGSTFYDAAYVIVAEKRGLTLITEDQDILSKYPKAIKPSQLEI